MAKPPRPPVKIEEVPTEEDIKRGDEILKRMLQSKPKPHKDMVGKKGRPDDGRRRDRGD